MESWLPAPDFEDFYEVSNDGIVRRSKPCKTWPAGRIVKSHIKDGYSIVQLSRGPGDFRTTSVHRLVARAFLGEPTADRPHVNHKDGVRTNNDVANLEWCSRSENLSHSYRVLGRDCPRGVGHHKTTLNDEQIREIRRIYRDDEMGQVLLARKFGVTQTTIWRIIHRMVWAHVSD